MCICTSTRLQHRASDIHDLYFVGNVLARLFERHLKHTYNLSSYIVSISSVDVIRAKLRRAKLIRRPLNFSRNDPWHNTYLLRWRLLLENRPPSSVASWHAHPILMVYSDHFADAFPARPQRSCSAPQLKVVDSQRDREWG